MISSYDTEVVIPEYSAKRYSDTVINFLSTQDGVTTPFRFQSRDGIIRSLRVGRHVYIPPASPNQWIVLGMWDESTTAPIPIGISERRLYPQQRLADGPHGMIGNDEEDDVILPGAFTSIRTIANPMASFNIQPAYQKKGLSDLLWTFTLATLNRLGYDTVKIMSDITGMNGHPSFYTRLTPGFTKNEHGSLMIPTMTTPLQQTVLTNILPP